ncbi:hypothetical protein [Saccharopolyspora pogona]|uniref:hypothetical protein n=1 Tax=Saccharopolyspora pogona TaxID=333966 RepID=UPI0016845103|nr:hypothetical protein [Saccharopolyspora pogona]
MARRLAGFDLSEDPSERPTQRLLAELRELGAVRVDRVRGGEGPEGAKCGAALQLGQLVLSGVFIGGHGSGVCEGAGRPLRLGKSP